MAAWGVGEMSVATGECLSVCLRPLSHPPPPTLSSHYTSFHFILMSAHSQAPNIKLCLKLEDASERTVSDTSLYSPR